MCERAEYDMSKTAGVRAARSQKGPAMEKGYTRVTYECGILIAFLMITGSSPRNCLYRRVAARLPTVAHTSTFVLQSLHAAAAASDNAYSGGLL